MTCYVTMPPAAERSNSIPQHQPRPVRTAPRQELPTPAAVTSELPDLVMNSSFIDKLASDSDTVDPYRRPLDAVSNLQQSVEAGNPTISAHRQKQRLTPARHAIIGRLRLKYGLDGIVSKAQPYFHLIKECHPFYFHG